MVVLGTGNYNRQSEQQRQESPHRFLLASYIRRLDYEGSWKSSINFFLILVRRFDLMPVALACSVGSFQWQSWAGLLPLQIFAGIYARLTWRGRVAALLQSVVVFHSRLA